MADEIKVSIIAPVYNVGEYLEQCMETLCGQTLKEIEIICVNDGSTDNSLSILESFAKKDPRVKIITKANAGIAAARNTGIEPALGEYILFVDSDDFIDKNYCEVLYSAAKKYDADLAFGGVASYCSDEKIKKGKVLKEFSREEKQHIKIDDANRSFFFSRGYKGIVTAWGRLIKRKMMNDNKILFYKERTSEDIPFTSLNFLYADTVTVDESVCYYYRQGVSSSLSKKTGNMVRAALKNFKNLKEDLFVRGKAKPELVKIVDLAACDVLFGYYDNWNTGGLSRCPVSVIKELYPDIRNIYFDFFDIRATVASSDNKAFKRKYKFFAFGIRHNIYIMPKILRFLRNVIRVFYPG